LRNPNKNINFARFFAVKFLECALKNLKIVHFANRTWQKQGFKLEKV